MAYTLSSSLLGYTSCLTPLATLWSLKLTFSLVFMQCFLLCFFSTFQTVQLRLLLKKFFFFLIYLAVAGLSCSMWDLVPCLGINSDGNGTPLQYSCLANPMDRRAWWAVVHGVEKSRT